MSVFCGSCGREIPETAKFCEYCGAEQAAFQAEEEQAPTEVLVSSSTPPPPPPQTPPPPPPSDAQSTQAPPPDAPIPAATTREKAERVAPGAEELVGQLATHLRAPGVALAGLAALIGLAVCLAAGLLLALVLPNSSFLAVGGGSGLVNEMMAQAVSFLQVNLQLADAETTVRTVPVLFVMLPIGGVAVGVAALASRTVGMSPRERFLWAAASGVPFAFLMLVIALSLGTTDFDLLSGQIEFNGGSVLLFGFLWGALGGLLGMLWAVRSEGGRMPDLSTRFSHPLGIGWAALRPLLLALLVIGALGTVIWMVQMVRDSDYRDFPPRSTAIGLGEQVAYAGDHAIDILPLGAGASERLSGWPAIPIAQDQFYELPDDPAASAASDYNVFDFNDTMPVFLFIPMLAVLILVPAALALYAGFAVARRLGEGRPDRAAAWGAIVGPVWAIAMVLLAALARKDVVGHPNGDSVFLAFLVGGAVLGAVGGMLAAQGGSATSAPADTRDSTR